MTLLLALKEIPGTVQITAGQQFHELNPEQAENWIRSGHARSVPAATSGRGWDGLHWEGAEVAILASGESLTVEQAQAVRAWRDHNPSGRKVITINTTFRRAPWADVLYACDGPWWEAKETGRTETYLEEARATTASQFWTQDAAAAKKHGLKHIASDRGGGLRTKTIGVIRQGANGGHQAIGLAYWSGARTVYLLGYDMRGGHWHGDHPAGLKKHNRFDVFLKALGELAAEVAAMPDFDVINCTPGSADKSLSKADWREVFA